MYPLGPFSPEAHRDVGRFALAHVDHLLVYGEEALPLHAAFSEAHKPAEHFSTHAALAERLKSLALPGDVVLIKGSRIMRMETIVEAYAAAFA